jgi:hypothetical protein
VPYSAYHEDRNENLGWRIFTYDFDIFCETYEGDDGFKKGKIFTKHYPGKWSQLPSGATDRIYKFQQNILKMKEIYYMLRKNMGNLDVIKLIVAFIGFEVKPCICYVCTSGN